MRTPLLLIVLAAAVGCGKATLDDDAAGDGDGDGDGDGGDDCGGTCTSDQVCIDAVCEELVDVAVAEVVSLWPEVTGWLAPNSQPIRATFVDVGLPGAVYQCRTGHADVFATLSFTACDGGDGSTPEHSPVPTTAMEEGGYRTEMRIAVGSFTSASIGFDFYAHHSLDGVPDCPPAHGDDEIFAAANPLLADAPAFDASAAVAAPFVHLPFRNVIREPNMNDGFPPTFATGDPFDVDILSLRRRFVLSPDRTMLLIQRRYESRMHRANLGTGTCRNSYRFGVNHNITTSPRRRYEDCVNFVLNSRGQGVCVVPGEGFARFRSEIGWAKLIRRKEAFSNKGRTATCTLPPCWAWYLHIPD